MYKKDLASNNLQWLICHKTKPNQTTHLYRPLRLLSPLDGIQCPHRVGECKFLLVDQNKRISFMIVCVYFYSNAQHVLLGYFVRLEVSGRAAAVLYGTTPMICSKLHAASLCSSHLAFSLGIS